MKQKEKEEFIRSVGEFVQKRVNAACAPLLDEIKALELRTIQLEQRLAEAEKREQPRKKLGIVA